MKVALLIPVCSRSCNFKTIEDAPFIKILYPSFLATKEEGFEYVFYLGMDDDDLFYQNHRSFFLNAGIQVVTLTGCQHAPALAWNQIFEEAIKDSTIDYFYQLAEVQ